MDDILIAEAEVTQPPCTSGDDKGEMGSELQTVEQRLKSLMGQLQYECAILERIVHKNKNQHRRGGYFQYLLKVRRDFRLLQSAKLEDLLSSCFLVIHGNKPKQKIHLLESLKWRKCDGGKPNFMERLCGATRILSQAIEPILKAAGEISILLARSFFMGFCLTTLSLLARLRVLAQQILLDVVSVFNAVSSLSQKRQSVKLTHNGVEIFREYYPTNQDYTTLECVWETDKFVLFEKTQKSEITSQVHDLDQIDSSAKAQVRYESIQALLEEDEEAELAPEVAEVNNDADEHLPLIKEGKTHSSTNSSINDEPGEEFREVEDNTSTVQFPENKLSTDGGSVSPSRSVTASDTKTETKRVAFISVKRPSPSKPSAVDLHLKKARKEDETKEDPFFNLLAGGNLTDTLF